MLEPDILGSNVKFLAIKGGDGNYMNYSVGYSDMSSQMCDAAYNQMSSYVNVVSAALSSAVSTDSNSYNNRFSDITHRLNAFADKSTGFLSVETAKQLSTSITSTIYSDITSLSSGISGTAKTQYDGLTLSSKHLFDCIDYLSNTMSSDLSDIATNRKAGLVKVNYADGTVSDMYFPVMTLTSEDGSEDSAKTDGYVFACITSADLDNKLCGYAGITYSGVVSYVNDVSSKLGENAQIFDKLSSDVIDLSSMTQCVANETQASSDAITVKQYVLLKQTLAVGTEADVLTSQYFIGCLNNGQMQLSSIQPKLTESVVPEEGIYKLLVAGSEETAALEYDVISCKRSDEYYDTYICMPSAYFNGIGNAKNDYVLNTVTADTLISANSTSTIYAAQWTEDSIKDQVANLSNNIANLNKVLTTNFGQRINDLTGSYIQTSQVTQPLTNGNKIVTQNDIKSLATAMHFTYAVKPDNGQNDIDAIDAAYAADKSKPAQGDVIIITTSSKEYVYSGDSWRELGDESITASAASLESEIEKRKDDDNVLSNAITALTTTVENAKTEVASNTMLGRIKANGSFSDTAKRSVQIDENNFAYVNMADYVLTSQVTSLENTLTALTATVEELKKQLGNLLNSSSADGTIGS